MAEVFISFIHEEEKVATAVGSLLRAQLRDRQVFLASDQWQIFAGEQWLERIKTELTSAVVVLLLLSPKSVERPWVNFEAGAAWLAGKAIIPACYGGLSKGVLPKPYSNIQALDLPGDAYYLVTSVAHHLRFPLATPPLVAGTSEHRALEQAISNLSALVA